MKPFKFQRFSIKQSEEVFRVGTDAVLLGALADVRGKHNILEVGTGTGIIALMIAQRNSDARITAIDINERSVNLAAENFSNSPFSDRITVLQTDYSLFQSDKTFDFIISNPPYFEENASSKDILARQKVALNFSHLVKKSAELLSPDGVFSVIIPFESLEEFKVQCLTYQLYLCRTVTVYGIEGSKPKRVVLEFSRTKQLLQEESLIIEQSPRKYSDQYLRLTKDFHIFKV